MTRTRLLIVTMTVLLTLSLLGCSNGPWAYQNTPYEPYKFFNAFSSRDDDPGIEIYHLVKKTQKAPNDFFVHWDIAQWAFKQGHYGTCLFALNECHKIRPMDQKVNYNIGVLLGMLGIQDGARGRLLYLEQFTSDYFLKNRAVAGLMKIDEGKRLNDEYFIQNY